MSPKRIIIDTDPGIDDALAILLALASPELRVEGLVTVHGNCTLEQATTNALGLLELAGRPDLPVVPGAPRPLVQPLLTAPETHGETGMGYGRLPDPSRGPVDRHGVEWMIETLLDSPGEVEVVALGPLTNIALALRMAPQIATAIPRLTIMGGAIREGGNTTPLAEFNTFCDPHAAHIVYQSGIPTTMVPLDVTYQVVLTTEHVDRLLETDSPVTRFVADSTRFYMEFHDQYQSIEGCVINDPLALALTFAPHLVATEAHPVGVDISGGTSMGKTYADFHRIRAKEPTIDVALGVDVAAFMDLFLERIERLARG